MKTVRRLFAFALVLVCLGAVCVLPASAMTLRPEVSISGEEEYLAFIKTEKKLPENFITAEKLRAFGEFDYFSSELFDKDSVLQYYYSLDAENGDSIGIIVWHTSYTTIEHSKPQEISIEEWADGSMRQLTQEEKGVLVRDKMVEYHYLNGQLTSIRWKTKDLVFKISISHGEWEYSKLTAGSLRQRLLSLSDEDFQSAVEELEQICGGPLLERISAWQAFLRFDLPYVLLIGAGVGLYLIIRRKKKKGKKSSQ